jgi:hypothetical protein
MEQHWMDEQDLWLIEFVSLHPHFQNSIRKQICITCNAPRTCMGKSQKTRKLHFGWARPWFEKWSKMGWMNRIYGY